MTAAELAERLNARKSGNGWIAKCPAHEDRKPSLSISEGKDGVVLLKCHAGCAQDALFAALEQLGVTKHDLFPASLRPYRNEQDDHKPTINARKQLSAPFHWRSCLLAFNNKLAEQIAQERGYSLEFVQELHRAEMIGSYKGLVAFPVHNRAGQIIGAHCRREDLSTWFYEPKGINTAPLVFGEIGDRPHIFESTWDGLAFMEKSGERDGIIIARGTANAKLVASLLPQRVAAYVWPQNDEPNEKFIRALVESAKCALQRVTIPVPYFGAKFDLNDWTRDGATAGDLFNALVQAQTLREAEYSWDDALAMSAVTSSQLRDLKLAPRKQLLADWFCEGDCGVVFAFRGVGKTWFVMALVQAISTGGKLGEWQAAEAVPVAYLDAEMPCTLMQQRSSGLGTSDNLVIINHEILFERSSKTLNIAEPEVQGALTRYCVNAGTKVLVVDNLSTAAFGMKENDADSWEKVIPWLLDLRRRKIAVILVHHAGRSGEMRGTTKREDSVFWIIALDDMKQHSADKDKRGARFISRFTKPSRNTQEPIPPYEWHFVTEQDGEVTISHKLAQSLEVFRSVVESGVTKCDEIADAMKVPKWQVSRWAKQAEDAGWLQRARGGYVLKKEVDP